MISTMRIAVGGDPVRTNVSLLASSRTTSETCLPLTMHSKRTLAPGAASEMRTTKPLLSASVEIPAAFAATTLAAAFTAGFFFFLRRSIHATTALAAATGDASRSPHENASPG